MSRPRLNSPMPQEVEVLALYEDGEKEVVVSEVK